MVYSSNRNKLDRTIQVFFISAGHRCCWLGGQHFNFLTAIVVASEMVELDVVGQIHQAING